MASPGLFLLLLLSSSLLLCSLSSPLSFNHSSSDQHKDRQLHLQKRTFDIKTIAKATQYIVKIGSAASPFIEMIPVAGPVIKNILDLTNSVLGEMKPDATIALLSEFKNLESQLQKYHVEQKWETWASQYSKYETNINIVWDEFLHLATVLGDKNNKKETKDNAIELFKKKFERISPGSEKLHQVLVAKKPSFHTDFGKTLMETFSCHEREIQSFTVLINSLIYKGNTVNHFYNSLMKDDRINDLAKIAFDSAKAMFEIHRECISKSLDYVKKDVAYLMKTNMKDSSNRKELAKKIRLFLETNYIRYNWITVVFITKHSKHGFFESLNKHILSGFTEVTEGEVTVAVARQLKGNHTKADKVRKAIETCLPKLVECNKVIDALSKCVKTDGIELSRAYSAIHVFIDKSHESSNTLDAKQAPSSQEEYIDSELNEIPYIYTGKCKKYKLLNSGQFKVLIKSDEEIIGGPPCQKLHCSDKGKGKCENLDNDQIPVCRCEDGFYGESCEDSIDDYKSQMMATSKRTR